MGGRKGKVRLCDDDRGEAQGAEQPVIVMKRVKGRGAKGLRRSTHNFRSPGAFARAQCQLTVRVFSLVYFPLTPSTLISETNRYSPELVGE